MNYSYSRHSSEYWDYWVIHGPLWLLRSPINCRANDTPFVLEKRDEKNICNQSKGKFEVE